MKPVSVERALKQLWTQIEAKSYSPEKKAKIVYHFLEIRDLLTK